MREPLQAPLAAPLPRLRLVRDDVRDTVAENALVVKELEVAVVGILDRTFPRRGVLARAEDGFGLRVAAEHDVDSLLDAEDAFLDAVADQLAAVVVERLGAGGKFRLVAEFDLLALGKAENTEHAALRH